jgi:hypothetical protein
MSTFDPFDIRNAGIPNDEVTRRLRERYAAPTGEYWDGLEARIMAAVVAGRDAANGVANDVGDWWLVLAGWARTGLIAATLAAVVAGSAAMHARDAANEEDPLVSLDATPLSRAGTVLPEAEELLWADGRGARRARAMQSPDSLRAVDSRREATFRYVMPY